MIAKFQYRDKVTAMMNKYVRDAWGGATFRETEGCYLFLEESIKEIHPDGLYRIVFRVPGYTLGTLFVDKEGVINKIDLLDIAKDDVKGPMKYTFFLNRDKFIGKKIDINKILSLLE